MKQTARCLLTPQKLQRSSPGFMLADRGEPAATPDPAVPGRILFVDAKPCSDSEMVLDVWDSSSGPWPNSFDLPFIDLMFCGDQFCNQLA